MSHGVRIKDKLWPLVVNEAARRVTVPSHLIDLAIRKELGLEPERVVIQKEERGEEDN